MNNADTLRQAYDADEFRQHGHQLVDLLADHLERQTSGRESIVLPWSDPEENYRFVESLMSKPGNVPGNDLLTETLARCMRLQHPRFCGHQITPPLPASALAGLMADLINIGMGVYEMGTVGVAIERYVVKLVAEQFGMDDQADGVLTSGGSLANLTALLAARRAQTDNDVWNDGHSHQLAVMVSEQAHYCVDRAVRIMGWGAQGVIRIPTNDRFQMQTDLLPRYLETARENGIQVIAVVGSACSTATGAFDDLTSIGEFCQANGIWFHVDGAHGAAVAFSKTHRPLVDGIHLADSVVLDFHKLLLTPAVTSALVYRRGNDGYRAFAQEASYLWSDANSAQWHDLAKRTFECTKTMCGLKVLNVVANHGTVIFEAQIDQVHDLARQFSELLKSQNDFALLVEPQTNIVCFRYLGKPNTSISPAELNQLNERTRQEIIRTGDFYFVQTNIEETLWLRTTLINAFTTIDDLEQLLDRIRTVAQQIAASAQ